MFIEFIDVFISGLTNGSVYALMAVGLTLVYGVSRVFNFAYGSFFSMGGYLAWILMVALGLLGGSSSINGMIYICGNPMDYQRWAADPGMQRWDYAHNLPYFKRAETRLIGANQYHGVNGPLMLETGPCRNPLFNAFFEAVQQAGYPLTDDVNGYRQEGFAPFDRNVYRGRRWSAAPGTPGNTRPCASTTSPPTRTAASGWKLSAAPAPS
jgi:choline dehydrogenase-like flavoprotein